MKFLESEMDVGSVPIGYVWESELLRVSFFQAVLFALVTGDWNKIHVNPLTFFFYRSNLGGMTCSGDMVLSLTKWGVHRIFSFEKDVEVIAFGYESVDFKRPLHVGSLFRYRYTLLDREIVKGAARCRWQIEIVDQRGKIICSAVWTNGYYPVVRTAVGRFSIPALTASGVVARCAFSIVLLAFVVFGWYFYHPMNDLCYPFAP